MQNNRLDNLFNVFSIFLIILGLCWIPASIFAAPPGTVWEERPRYSDSEGNEITTLPFGFTCNPGGVCKDPEGRVINMRNKGFAALPGMVTRVELPTMDDQNVNGECRDFTNTGTLPHFLPTDTIEEWFGAPTYPPHPGTRSAPPVDLTSTACAPCGVCPPGKNCGVDNCGIPDGCATCSGTDTCVDGICEAAVCIPPAPTLNSNWECSGGSILGGNTGSTVDTRSECADWCVNSFPLSTCVELNTTEDDADCGTIDSADCNCYGGATVRVNNFGSNCTAVVNGDNWYAGLVANSCTTCTPTCGACGDYSDTCDESGTQECSAADCSVFTQACTRDTDGDACVAGGTCTAGACVGGGSISCGSSIADRNCYSGAGPIASKGYAGFSDSCSGTPSGHSSSNPCGSANQNDCEAFCEGIVGTTCVVMEAEIVFAQDSPACNEVDIDCVCDCYGAGSILETGNSDGAFCDGSADDCENHPWYAGNTCS